MTELVTIYTVDRIPYTAAAKNTVGYKSIPFEVIADSEGEAIRKAKRASSYDPQHFSWRCRSARVVER